ncbi:Ig-like domain-containing protein [Methanobacterium formicicum]|uniref:WD40 domain-containing protein n=1 Tax=Methanobacterium formicicum (strain DSM 3637 / PP1) TaxID=1204725 RepID=K2RRY4_METFP|nr:Ig-like domain-containing protein [Methanobacterium formicicum]EKF85510.1 WD40 domain-containing protein [Methanobacterium formicicum DSM 3637]
MANIKKIFVFIILLTVLTLVTGTVSATNTTELVSIHTNGSQSANGYSYEPSISADGHYIAFSSNANNLIDNDTNYCSDIFVRDRLLNITERISISNTGEEGNGDSYEPSISSDGRYVTFTSYASNLVSNDVNGYRDVFVRDRLLNVTQRLSVSSTGEEGNGDSYEPSISSDGCYVTFYSYASNLVENDTNGVNDIFVYNRLLKTIKLISISFNGEEANSDSYEPFISTDGNFIVFTSYASNLVENDTNDASDVFVFHQKLNTIKRVSVSFDDGNGNNDSFEPCISSDGRYIAFSSFTSNLVENDTNIRDVFIFDQISGVTERVSISNADEKSIENNYNPSISGDGRYVAFVSGNTKPAVSKSLSSFENEDEIVDIFVCDLWSKITRKITISSTGEEANANSEDPVISGNGQYVAFRSYATNLVQGYDNDYGNIFVHDIDNTASISAVLYPDIVKSGDQITVRVYSPNSAHITVLILGKTFEMDKRADGQWYFTYVVPTIPDGIYDVLLTATDGAGNQDEVNLKFNVDNKPPLISATVTPNLVKSEDYISVDVLSSPDTMVVTALICGETFNLYKQDNGWNLDYVTPKLSEGSYPIFLTAMDKVGNQNTALVNFTVDNGPPTISGSLTPDTVKTYDNITITAISDFDATHVTALILNQTYDLIKQMNGTWVLRYEVPYTPDGTYPIILTAVDSAGNRKTFPLNFNVYNPLDNQAPVISGTVTHTNRLNDLFTEEPQIYFQAFSDPDVVSITASLLRWEYNLYRQEDGSWTREGGGWLEQGNYTVLFTAKDWSGNQGSQLINLCVENIIPLITPTLSSTKIRSGDSFVLTVTVNPDPEKVYVSTPSGVLDLQKQLDGSWSVDYTVPNLSDGYKEINIICSYGIGWISLMYTRLSTAEKSIGFIVDNTPPNFSESVTPNPIKSGDPLKIWVSCTTGSYYVPDDTAQVTVTAFENIFNLNCLGRGSDWFKSNSFSDWSIELIVPNLPDGVYPVWITATDEAGNQKTKIFNLTVDNTPPVIIGSITPNMVNSVDFENRKEIITLQSSLDTKEVYALLAGTWTTLNFYNGNWLLDFTLPPVMDIGDYKIPIKTIDYAGNIGSGAIYFTVFDNYDINLIGFSEQNNENTGSSGSTGSDSSGTSGSSGSNNSEPPDSNGSNSPEPNSGGTNNQGSSTDYLPWIILAILIILLFVLLVLIFPIIGVIIMELLSLIVEILFYTQLPRFLWFMFEVFFALTDITSAIGFSFTAIAIFLDAAVGSGVGLIVGLIFAFAGLVVGELGMSLFGLIILILTLFFTLSSIIESGKKWWDNLISRF